MCVLRSDHKPAGWANQASVNEPRPKAVSILPKLAPVEERVFQPPPLRAFVNRHRDIDIRLGIIVATVCRHIGVEREELVGTGRRPQCVLARRLITALSRQCTSASYPRIAREIERPTHSTLIAAHDRLRSEMAKPADEQDRIDIAGENMTISELFARLEQLVVVRFEGTR